MALSKLLRSQPAKSQPRLVILQAWLRGILVLIILIVVIALLAIGGFWLLQHRYLGENRSISPEPETSSEEWLVKLVVTEPLDGTLSPTETTVLSGQTLPSSWALVLTPTAIQPIQANGRGYFSLPIKLAVGVNRVITVVFLPHDRPRVKNLLVLYLPNVELPQEEEAWIGQVRRQANEQLSLSAWSGSQKGNLVTAIPSQQLPDSLRIEDFVVLVGQWKTEQFAARQITKVAFPEIAVTQVSHTEGGDRLETVSGFPVRDWQEFSGLPTVRYAVHDGSVRDGYLDELASESVVISLGWRDASGIHTLWEKLVAIDYE